MRGRHALMAVGVLAVAGLVVRAAFDRPTPPRPAPEHEAASPPEPRVGDLPVPTVTPTARPLGTTPARPTAAATPSVATPESLVATLRSTDELAIVEAVNGLLETKATSALPDLERIDITKNARAAPSVIDALGRLGAIAERPARRSATDRLLALLAQERARVAPESDANVLALYAALGRTLDPRAAPALEAELLDPRVTLAAKTVIVEALERLKQPSSAAALRTLQQQLATQVGADKLEEDIRLELVTAVQQALKTLS